jgi:aspartate/methionine/tyrosine aminotransferase
VLFVSQPADPFDDDVEKLIDWALTDPAVQVFVNNSWGLLAEPKAFLARSRVHVLHAIDRFAGSSGFPLALLFTTDSSLLATIKACNGSYRNNSHTEFVYRRALETGTFEVMIGAFQTRFAEAKAFFVTAVEKEGIAVKVFESSVFASIDLSQFITTAGEEEEFATKLLEEHKVWVVPAGVEFGVQAHGFYLVNVARQSGDLQAGVEKLLKGIAELKGI